MVEKVYRPDIIGQEVILRATGRRLKDDDNFSFDVVAHASLRIAGDGTFRHA